ncbi:helix-turn-helix domain-containing protein [Paenibacillus pedocola]|uniref:helix-turn-helix domain-containing protein n=1 Tax=Paenibacillus pedocola TaxID=3242193 RepID=UPI00287791A6|nr:helix-turn-helix domain-containing protein [Paenibacillus typhae]
MKKWSSAFTSLAISYISIVLVIVLLLCSVFYIYFSSHYKEELRSRNQLILKNTAGTIEASVLQRVQQIYLEVSLKQTATLRLLAGASFSSNLSKVSSLQDMLQAEVASNSDIIQAVHLYSPGQQVMLSSLYGLKYNADQGTGAAFWMDWINGMGNNPLNSLWTEARWVPEDISSSVPGGSGSHLITYAHSYPFQSSGADSDLIIAIDVKESAIRAIMQNMMPPQYQSTFISGPSGSMMAGSDQAPMAQRAGYASSIAKAWTSPDEAGSFSENINDTSYVISYQTLPSAGWKIFSAAPASLFYERWSVVQQLILGICLFALVLGIGLSGILAKANYSPIKRLLGTIRDFTGPAPEQAMNEFKVIDSAFIRLNDKVSSLEDTLQASTPHIKQNLILNLLQNSTASEPMAIDPEFLGISLEHTHFCCLLLNTRGAYTHMSSTHIQTAMARITSQLEEIRFPGIRIIAEELPDKRIIGIVCAREASGDLVEQISQLMVSEGRQQFQMEVQLSQGRWVSAVADLHISYSEAQTLMKYAYFLPETVILNDRSLLERESSLDEIPQPALLKFKDKLQARKLDEIAAALEQLITPMREDRFPADYCHFILANTVFVYSDYLKSIRYKHPVHGHMDLYNEYIALSNILHFREWLLHSITAFIAETEKRNSDRALSTIEAAKQYIERHLSGDLSLDAVSSKVFISPKYLSKLFKEELGVTYTDYITGRRMEQAKRLLANNDMSIDQIAVTVGYGTTAYFIKRFKEMYGCTPGNYLRTVNEVQLLQAETSFG